jgi:hypothetical protein
MLKGITVAVTPQVRSKADHANIGVLAQCSRELFCHTDEATAHPGCVRSVEKLKCAIQWFIAETNLDPRPLIWTKNPATILAAVKKRAPSVRV